MLARQESKTFTFRVRPLWTTLIGKALTLPLFLAAAAIGTSTPAAAQQALHQYTAESGAYEMRVIRSNGDFNGDGVADTLAASNDQMLGWNIQAFSGVDGKELWSVGKNGAWDPIDAAIGDVDGDGYPDALVSLRVYFGSGAWSGVLLISGRSGTILAEYLGYEEKDGFGERVEIHDLGSRNSIPRMIVASKATFDAEITTKVGIYSYDDGDIWHECEFDTGIVDAEIGGIAPIADITGDGIKEVVVGIPSLSNGTLTNAGAIYILDGSDCSATKIMDGPSQNGKLGQYLTALPDLDGDAIPDLGIGTRAAMTIHSGANLGYLNKVVFAPSSTIETERFHPLSDLNGDGQIEFGAIATDSSEALGKRVVILSGADNRIIGNFPVDPFKVPHNSSWRLDSDEAGLFSSPLVDKNRDGIADIVLYVRPYRSGARIDYESPTADVTTISGTCPRDAKIDFINLSEEHLVEAGERPIFVKVTACGVTLAGTISLTIGNKTYTMRDDGINGDEVQGDRIYTATATVPKGQSNVRVVANVNNSMALRVEKTISIQSTYNYSIITKEAEWISHWSHDRFNFDPRSPQAATIRMPFAFEFYGLPFTEMVAYGRGLIVPTYPNLPPSQFDEDRNQPMPASSVDIPAIAAAWGLTFFAERSVLYTKTIGTPGSRKFVITFEYLEGWGKYTEEEKTRLDYQVVLHEDTGRITANYKMIFSSNDLNSNGLRVTMGVQASSLFGITFSHNAAVVSEPITIEYIPGSGDNGGGDGGGGDGGGGGGGDGGGGDGGGGDGGDDGGDGGDDRGDGGGSGGTGGGTGGTGDNGGNPTGGLTNSSFQLLFSFAQRKNGANMRFDIQSNTPAAKQALNNCALSVLAGQGANAATATYRPIATIYSDNGTRAIPLQRFRQPLRAPSKQGNKRKSTTQNLFLRANAVCSSGQINLSSQPIKIKTSRAKIAIPAARWTKQLAANLRRQ